MQICLTFAALIAVCRIEMVESVCDKGVDHFLAFVIVHSIVFHRQTHTAEPEILFDLFEKAPIPSSRFNVFRKV